MNRLTIKYLKRPHLPYIRGALVPRRPAPWRAVGGQIGKECSLMTLRWSCGGRAGEFERWRGSDMNFVKIWALGAGRANWQVNSLMALRWSFGARAGKLKEMQFWNGFWWDVDFWRAGRTNWKEIQLKRFAPLVVGRANLQENGLWHGISLKIEFWGPGEQIEKRFNFSVLLLWWSGGRIWKKTVSDTEFC